MEKFIPKKTTLKQNIKDKSDEISQPIIITPNVVEIHEDEEDFFESENEKVILPNPKEKKRKIKFWDGLEKFQKDQSALGLNLLQIKILYYIRFFKSPFPRTIWNIANWLNSNEDEIKKEIDFLQTKIHEIKAELYNHGIGYIYIKESKPKTI